MPTHVNSNDPLSPVLIVDDSPDDIFFLVRGVAATGARNRLITFASGEDVLIYLRGLCAMARSGNPQLPCLMFTDLHMPRVDGFEVLAWSRQQSALEGMKVVITSSSDLPEDVARASALGAFRFLVKYPGVKELAELIRRAMNPHPAAGAPLPRRQGHGQPA